MNELTPLESPRDLVIAQLNEDSDRYRASSISENTKRSYQCGIKLFVRYCETMGLESCPALPDTVCNFATLLRKAKKNKVSSIDRRLAAIAHLHKVNQYDSPTRSQRVKDMMAGLRRMEGEAPRRMVAATSDIIKKMVAPNDSLHDIRNRALILLGFSGALRRSEIAALCLENISFSDEGMTVFLAQSKTDQEGKGHLLHIAYGTKKESCPVRSMKAWIEASNLSNPEAPLFQGIKKDGKTLLNRHLCGDSINKIVKKTVKKTDCGLDENQFGGHSLRAGYATTMDLNGERGANIQAGGRWLSNVFTIYIRPEKTYDLTSNLSL